MQLLSLRVENFGIFRGTHFFDLVAPSVGDHAPNLTIFVGHNGAGKSTLFQAIAVALHGIQALGDKVTTLHYQDFLYGHMHRHKEGSKTVVSTEASVSLSLSHVQSGNPRRVYVTRRWQRNGRTVSEALEVSQDSELLTAEAADAQAWINDLLPPDMARLCFFDAEDLDALAGAGQRNPALGEALKRLLGIDLIQRAQADLRAYILKQGGSNVVSSLRQVVLTHQTSLEGIDRKLVTLKTQIEELSEQETTAQALIAEKERLLAAAGGLYAARRIVQQERLEAIEEQITAARTQIADQAAHLLPFSLSPSLCRRLAARLTEEEELQREQVAQTLLQEKMEQLQAITSETEFFIDLKIGLAKQEEIRRRFSAALQNHLPKSSMNVSLRHHLAAPERAQLQNWISEATTVAPSQVQQVGERLRSLQKEQRTLELDLQRAPDDASLAPLHASVLEHQATLASLQAQRGQIGEQTGAEQYRRADKERAMQNAITALIEAQSGETELVLAERSRTVLRAYEIELTRQRLFALEQSLVACFNKLCQKDHLLTAVTIQPDDFTVELKSMDGRSLSLSSFSAGERQLYALALLQAMRQVSDRQLPMLVDTPLARLDAEHRHRLLHDYLPVVSDQILLFATDAEADTPFLSAAQPYLAYAYRLKFDPERGDTEATLIEQPSSLPSEYRSVQELPHVF